MPDGAFGILPRRIFVVIQFLPFLRARYLFRCKPAARNSLARGSDGRGVGGHSSVSVRVDRSTGGRRGRPDLPASPDDMSALGGGLGASSLRANHVSILLRRRQTSAERLSRLLDP